MGDFNIFAWSDTIPLCEDLWLGMQARNIAIVDLSVIRQVECEAVAEFHEHDRTPLPTLMMLSALSQMWTFSLYEFLRTWRQRARELLATADLYASAAAPDRDSFLKDAVEKAKKKERFILSAPSYYAGQIGDIADAEFVGRIRKYLGESEELFRSTELLRVTLAKHEVPKTAGLIAEAPGYGRMNLMDGSMYWSVNLKDGSQTMINRRELADEFLGLDDDRDAA
jgi:hypothetical protein